MNFQFYLEKLLNSKNFEEFKKENPDAYLCSGFFSVDKKGNDNQQHLDLYVPSAKKMFSFQLEKEIEPVLLETYDQRVPEKLDNNLNFDFNEVEEMIKEKIQEEKINNQIQKILLSLQSIKQKNFFIGTIFVSGMGILKVTINLDENKIIDFSKKSFFDIMKIIKKKKN